MRHRDNEAFGNQYTNPYTRFLRERETAEADVSEEFMEIGKPSISDVTAFFSEKWALVLHLLLLASLWYFQSVPVGNMAEFVWKHPAGAPFDSAQPLMWFSPFWHQSASQLASNFFIIYVIAWRFGNIISLGRFVALIAFSLAGGIYLQVLMQQNLQFHLFGMSPVVSGMAIFLLMAQLKTGMNKVTDDLLLWLIIAFKFVLEAKLLGKYQLVETDPFLPWYCLGGAAGGLVWFFVSSAFHSWMQRLKA